MDARIELALALAAAKSRQDVPAAMRLFHRDMLLETPAFFDLSELCAQSGVSTDAVRRPLFGEAR